MNESSILVSILYLITTFFALITEIFLNPISFIPDSRALLVGMVLILIIYRFKKIKIISDSLAKINLFILSALTVFTYFVLILENAYGFQFAATRLNLNYSRLVYLTLTCAILALYSISFKLSKLRLKKIIFLSPIYFGLVALFIYTRNNAFFRILVKDDHLVEYLQFFLLLACAYLSFRQAKHWKDKENVLKVLFTISGLACLFVAGEEISWGQRLIGLETPEMIAEKNIQNELTLHNIGFVFALVYRGYMAIGLVGSTGWIFFKLIKNKLSKRLKKILANIIPDWYLSLFFSQAFFFNLDRFYISLRTGETLWEEPMELLLIIGITIFFIGKYFKVVKNKNLSS